MAFYPCNNYNSKLLLVVSGIKRTGTVYTIRNDNTQTFDLSSFSGFHSWKIDDFIFKMTQGPNLTFPRDTASAYYTPSRISTWDSDTGGITVYKGLLTGRSTSGSYSGATAVEDLYVIT